jgi:hypothetical protein
MEIGPVEYLEVAFPGNEFNGDILPALQELVDNETIHILDLVIVTKNAHGEVTALELSELEGDVADRMRPLNIMGLDLLSLQDITLLASDLDNNSTAALLVFENTWAARFASAVRDSGGFMIANDRLPHDVVEAAIEFLESESE